MKTKQNNNGVSCKYGNRFNAVGVACVRYPVAVAPKPAQGEALHFQYTVGTFDMLTVYREADGRPNPDLFVNFLRSCSTLDLQQVPELLHSVRAQMGTASAGMRVRLPLFMRRSSDVEGLVSYDAELRAIISEDDLCGFRLCVSVPLAALCVGRDGVSAGHLSIEVETAPKAYEPPREETDEEIAGQLDAWDPSANDTVWFEDLYEIAERAAKQEGVHIADACAQDLLDNIGGVTWWRIIYKASGSAHSHDAYDSLTGGVAQPHLSNFPETLTR